MAVKLKGLNFKTLVLKHGEKIVFAVVGALVLFALVGTKWMPYQGHPMEITNAVKEAEDKLLHKIWPEEEQEQYEVPAGESVADLVKNVRHQVDPTNYLFTQKFRFDLNETTTPITEPTFQPVKSLIADADRMVIYVSPEPMMDWYAEDQLMTDAEGTEEPAEPSEEDNIPDAFKMPVTGMQPGGYGQYPSGQYPGGGGRLGGGRLPPGVDPSMMDPSMLGMLDEFGAGMAGPPGRRQAAGRRGGTRPGQRTRAGQSTRMGQAGTGRRTAPGAAPGMAANMALGMGMDEYDEYGEFGFGGGLGGGFGGYGSEGRGLRYVAVRGAFPLRDQLEEIKKACNLTALFEAEQYFHIIDFELERKKRLKDADEPWSGEWEMVDIEVAKEILREAASFAPEMHEGIVTDAGMTMPLPQRAMGIYGDHGTHPELEEFELSEEELQRETQMLQILLDEHNKMMENQPEELITKGGWSDFIHDSRSMMTSLRSPMGGMGAMGGGMPDYAYEDEEDMFGGGGGGFGGFFGGRGIGGQFQPVEDPESIFKKLEEAATDKEKKELLKEHAKKQISVEGEMLLFRYLDFDVEPGESYKYRVRLKVTNPNFGRRPAEAAGLDYVVEGQTRWTDWSNETEPVYVRPDVDYFIQKVATRGGDPMRVQAEFTVFQWDPEAGTTVTDSDLEVELGGEIGGYGNPHVLDPALNRFEIQENYEFQTGDLIVDAAFVDSINPNRHPDLQLPPSTRRDPGVSDQVLVVRRDGELSIVDERSRLDELKVRKDYLGYEQRNYADIKGLEAQQSRAPIGAAGFEGMEGMEEFEGLLGGIYGDDIEGLNPAGARGGDRYGRGQRGSNILRRTGGARGGRR